MADIAQELITRQQKLATDRSNWDSRWQQVAERVMPWRANFQGNTTLPPDQPIHLIYDSTATLALTRFAAVLESMLTPSNQKWHSIKPLDPSLQRNYVVTRYLEEMRDLLFRARYEPEAGFTGIINEVYVSLGCFGTGVMMVEDEVGKGLRYQAMHLSEVFLAHDCRGRLDTVYRRYKYTSRQAQQKFKDNTPQKVTNELEKNPDKEFEFLHVVMPNDEHVQGAMGASGMPYQSFYVFVDEKKLIGRGAYRTMPYAAPRYMTAGAPYGWGPAMMVLPEIKTANEIRRTLLRQGQLAVDPPILLPDNAGVLRPFQTRPGAENRGMVNQDGKPMALPFETGARLQDGQAELEQCRRTINDAMLVTLFQLLIDSPQKTATEVLELAREKGVLLAPPMGRQQTELLGPIINRELDILAAAGIGPPMPEELRQSGAGVQIDYESDLSRFQRATDAASVARTMEVLTPFLQLKPEILDVFDEDEVARSVADVSGMPIRYLRDPDATAQIRNNRQAQQQAAMDQQNVATNAMAARNMAQTQKIQQTLQ